MAPGWGWDAVECNRDMTQIGATTGAGKVTQRLVTVGLALTAAMGDTTKGTEAATGSTHGSEEEEEAAREARTVITITVAGVAGTPTHLAAGATTTIMAKARVVTEARGITIGKGTATLGLPTAGCVAERSNSN